MDARTALRRVVARALSDPSFDPEGVANIEVLRQGLAGEMAELAAESLLGERSPSAATSDTDTGQPAGVALQRAGRTDTRHGHPKQH